MHDTLKKMMERALVGLGTAHLARRQHGRSAAILAYHNIVPRGEAPNGETPLHLDQSEFARQLELLSETHRIVGLDELFAEECSDRPRAVITFDDAYRGAMTAGLTELTSRELPATYFVSPGLLGGTTFWWDAIAAAYSGTLDDSIRRAALSECGGRQTRVLRWADRQGIKYESVPEHSRSAGEEEVRAAGRRPGITLGSHTWSHPNLGRIDADEAGREIRRSKEWLRKETETAIPWLAYPYGIPPAPGSDIRLAGDEYAVTVDGRLVDLGHDRLDPRRIPRLNIPSGMSLARFELLTSGI